MLVSEDDNLKLYDEDARVINLFSFSWIYIHVLDRSPVQVLSATLSNRTAVTGMPLIEESV